MSSSRPTTLREAFRQHLVVTQHKPRTIEAYIEAVTQLHRFLGGQSMLRVSVNDIRAYLFHLLCEREYASRTYNQHLYALKAFYKAFLPDVPLMSLFGRHTTRNKAIAVVSRFDFDRMLMRTENLKHRAVLMLLYSAGLRCSECASITIDSFDTDRMLIRVQGKGDRVRHTIFSWECRAVLREYVRAKRPTTVLFPGRGGTHISKEMVGHIVREAAKRAQLKQRVSPHTLRHSFATHFLETDGRLPVLQAMLGHEHPKTTYRYCHVDTSLIRSATSPMDVPIEQFGPRPRHRRRA